MTRTVYSLCDLTGNAVRPWAEAGWACVCFDLQHPMGGATVERFPSGGTIARRYADVLRLSPEDMPGAAFVFAWPPCTDLAGSGARWWPYKGLRAHAFALLTVDACRLLCEFSGAPWMLENPVGRLSSDWREPDHAFDPCDYGDPYTKRTCLWTGGGFVMPPVVRAHEPSLFGEAVTAVEPTDGSRMHLLPPSADRANLRSETPMGFARAVFHANAPRLRAERAA